MTDSQTPITDAIVHSPESDLLHSNVYSANIAALIHVSRRLERDRADLVAALELICDKATALTPEIAEAIATLARVSPANTASRVRP